MAEVSSSFEVGAAVEIHGLSGKLGSRFNGCIGVVKQINTDGRREVQLQQSDRIPVVKASNLRSVQTGSTDSASQPSAPLQGEKHVFEIQGLSSERGHLLNGLLCCTVGKREAGGRFPVAIFATGERKSLKETNLRQRGTREVLEQAQCLLRDGRLYEVHRLLEGLPDAPESVVSSLQCQLKEGTYSETPGNRIQLVDIPGRGKGYRAARDILAGEVILFDSAFCSCKEGPQESYRDLEEQCKSKTGSAASFLAEHVMALDPGPLRLRIMHWTRLVPILRNNMFKTIRDPGSALFVAVSRFNHSCCANAFADTSKDFAVVRALRDIPEGEEVCISYVPVAQPRAMRQKHLLGKGFQCTCPRCEKEKTNDPQFSVACKCKSHCFSAQDCELPLQICPSCGSQFDKESSLTLLGQFEEANAFMRTAAAAATNPLDLAEKFEQVADLVGCNELSPPPTSHLQTVQFWNNLSGAHYFAATRVPGPHRDASSAAAYAYKKRVLDADGTNHGATAQRDVNYFQKLYRTLMFEFPSAAEKTACEKEMEERCLLQFGQVSLPAQIRAAVST